MSSSPNQFALFATEVAFAVTLIGIAAFSVLVFWSLNFIIGVISRSPPIVCKLALGILLIAIHFGLLLLVQYLFPSFLGCPSAFAVLTKRGETCSAASPHWSTYIYGLAGIVWGLHSLFMQQATYWFNKAKWEEEKEQKATKAQEDSLAKSQAHDTLKTLKALRNEIETPTERLGALERAHSKAAREVTALQQAVLDKD